MSENLLAVETIEGNFGDERDEILVDGRSRQHQVNRPYLSFLSIRNPGLLPLQRLLILFLLFQLSLSFTSEPATSLKCPGLGLLWDVAACMAARGPGEEEGADGLHVFLKTVCAIVLWHSHGRCHRREQLRKEFWSSGMHPHREPSSSRGKWGRGRKRCRRALALFSPSIKLFTSVQLITKINNKITLGSKLLRSSLQSGNQEKTELIHANNSYFLFRTSLNLCFLICKIRIRIISMPWGSCQA